MTRSELLERAKPILFNAEMVRAIQGGTKTVTRRVIKLKYGNTHIEWHKDKYGKRLVEMQNDVEGETYGVRDDGTHWQKVLAMREIKLPYKVGDILYVRETWQSIKVPSLKNLRYVYKASDEGRRFEANVVGWTWRPSIHMPKEAARIFLRVTNVRAERLQDMTDEDCAKDGGFSIYAIQAVGKERLFGGLWNSTIKKSDLDKYGWAANPWVTVTEFERLEVEAL